MMTEGLIFLHEESASGAINGITIYVYLRKRLLPAVQPFSYLDLVITSTAAVNLVMRCVSARMS
jgi:hypothetical protein